MNISSLSINRPVLATVISIVLLPFDTIAQETRFQDIRKRTIKLQHIDTTNVFAYESSMAIMYFDKKDIEEHVASMAADIRPAYQPFLDALKRHDTQLSVKCDTIYDAVGANEFIRGAGGRDARDILVWGMLDISAELLLKGKVLPYSKVTGTYETKRIRCKNEPAEFPLDMVVPSGTRLLVFRFPDGIEIYHVVTALGE